MAEPTLFDEASLALIASGGAGKDGKVYSIKPVPEYGPEKVTNGDFATDSNWTKGNGATISGGKANIIGDGSTYVSITQNSVFTTGRKYRVSADVEINSGLGLKFQDGATNENIGFATSSGTYVFDFTAGSNTSLVVGRRTGGTAFNSSVDNISVKEISNDGDFAFSRGSNLSATRVGPDGLIEKGRENLLTQNNTFSSSNWAKFNASVTSGQSGYDGSSDAWKWNETATAGEHQLKQAFAQSGVNCLSIYAKAAERDVILFRMNLSSSWTNVFFNLTSGSVVSTGGFVDATITSVGNGWYRCEAVFNNLTGSTIQYQLGLNNTTFSYTGESGKGIFIQNAQLEIGLAATEVIESGASTGKAGLLEDEPRFDYSGGATCPSLLLEPSRTNLIPQTEYFGSGSGWSLLNNVSIGNFVLSPEGKMNATELVFDGSANGRIERVISGLTSGADYSVSLYARVASGTQDIFFGSFQDEPAVTLTTEWQRLEKTQPENDTNAYPRIRCNDATTIEIYGFQHELGSYATSYIPNHSGGTITRGADVCNSAGDSSTFNDSEGVLYAEISALANDGTNRRITISDGGFNNSVQIYYYPISNRVRASVTSGGITSIDATAALSDATNYHKIAIRYKTNDFSLWVDGVEVGTDTSGNAPSGLDELAFNDAGGSNFYGNVKQVLVFNTALSDTECIKLTTI